MTARPFRVLLAEDDDDHADLLSYGLERLSSDVDLERVRDGREALTHLRECAAGDDGLPDLMLLDLNMPRVGGLEVLEAVKGDAELRSLPVVILSTSDAERDRAAAYALHANSYLVKPTDFEGYGALLGDLVRYWSVWNRPDGGRPGVR